MSNYSENNENNIEETDISELEEEILTEELYAEDDTFGLPENISEDTGSSYSEPLPQRSKPSLPVFSFTRNTVIGIVGAIGIILVFGVAVLCDKKGSNPRMLFADMVNPTSSATTTYSKPTAATTEATTEATTAATTAPEETTR